ncbi:MAG: hypothetical protein EZS28_041411 [Streblomastix strix]|uniref:Uncharacterized protein n=1 Tax=Streblomastix strix TaxID=222440 RepID=A0A5J4TYN0_9EUKA|nr:MAG: hypothetical protein EZS28_041411 [Streblomastix strix]
MQSSSTDKQGPDKQPMTHNEAAEQILTLARIRAQLQDSEQTKAQLIHLRFGEDNLDLRTNVEDFRQNLLAASESLISKLDKRTRVQQVAEMAMYAQIKLEPYSQQSDSIYLSDYIEQTPIRSARHSKIKTLQGKDSGRRLSKQCRSKSERTWEKI